MSKTNSIALYLLVDITGRAVYDITPVADIFKRAIGSENMITDIRDLTSDLAFNMLQIASQNQNETVAENIVEAAYDIHLMRSWEQVKTLPDYELALSEALTIENMACRTDQ